MAFYNAVEHAIESDNGIPLARLTEQVRVTEAWGIADWWEGQAEERDRLREEISIAEKAQKAAENELERARETIAKLLRQLRTLQQQLDEERDKIADLEDVIVELKKGGANA